MAEGVTIRASVSERLLLETASKNKQRRKDYEEEEDEEGEGEEGSKN